MFLAAFILICISLRSLPAFDVTENEDPLARWGIKRVDDSKDDPKKDPKDDPKEDPEEDGGAGIEKIKSKFSENLPTTCDTLYKTDSAPFTAIVLYKNSGRFLCMGSIVDHSHILTCRMCYERTDAADLRVVLGYYKPWWGEHSQVIGVSKIIKHEYEVALLRLKDKIKYTDYIQATKLPATTSKSDDAFDTNFPPPYFVVGLDVERYDAPGTPISKDKRYQIKQGNYVEIKSCIKENYDKHLIEKTKLFCTEGNATTFCWGARGSPVLQKAATYYVQIGVVVADNCTSKTTGRLLVARADVYGDWIRGNSFHGHQAM